jgi:FtsP/CotA-like multicopper oxidase with cupredoxin domain
VPAAPGRTALVAAGLVAGALVLTGLRVATTAGLARAGWWFAGEKVTLALPLVVVPGLAAAAVSLPRLLRLARGRERPGDTRPLIALPPLVAAFGGIAGVACALLISYPVPASGAAVLLAVVAAATAISWRLLPGGRPGRSWRIGGTAVLAAGVVWAVTGLGQGGHLHTGHGRGTPGVGVDRLLGPPGAVRRFTLTAQPGTVTLASGERVDAWTFNGRSPGPTLRVRQGETVEVTLRDRLPGQGVTLHWHGYDVPGGEDGVPGVTQDAVRPGGEHVYRFRAGDPGTYWYHSHENPSVAIPRGLFGMLVVDPAVPARESDHTVALHTFAGRPTVTVDGSPPSAGLAPLAVPPGTRVRLRVAGTDSAPRVLGLSGTPYRLAAVDGRDVTGATGLAAQRLPLAAGGRYDLTFTMPAGPVLLSVDGRPDRGVILNGPAGPATRASAGPMLDITSYGTRPPGTAPAHVDQEITWVLDRTFAAVDGVPMLAHTVNGEAWPNIPTPVVRPGQTIKITVVNRSRDTHPMHPHGHHVLVLSRDGRPATGSPLWMDTFDVGPGEVWVVALKADNPGIWMFHCHDLGHAAQGMAFHLAYEGVTTPYDTGGAAANRPG